MLEKNKLLDQRLSSRNEITVVEFMSVIDVRVMKVRMYAGRKEISQICADLNRRIVNLSDAEKYLTQFNSRKISNEKFCDFIENSDYSSQTGLIRCLFIDLDERLQSKAFDIAKLKKIMQSDPTVEHILSQTPNFKARALGFRNEADFEEWQNMIGNLAMLEKRINSAIGNLDLSEKINGYTKSLFRPTKELATKSAVNLTFKKDDLVRRNKDLAVDFTGRWRA